MREVSLALLDVVGNSIDAGATLIEIDITVSSEHTAFEVKDNGVGMDEGTLAAAMLKGVSFKGSSGLGLALLKEEAESTGGNVKIISKSGKGTTVSASFYGLQTASSGDLGATYVTLIDDSYDVVMNVDLFGNKTGYDSREIKSSSDTAYLQSSGTLRLIREDINKNIRRNGGAML